MQSDPLIRRCISQMAVSPGNQRLVCRNISRDERNQLNRTGRKKQGGGAIVHEPPQKA